VIRYFCAVIWMRFAAGVVENSDDRRAAFGRLHREFHGELRQTRVLSRHVLHGLIH